MVGAAGFELAASCSQSQRPDCPGNRNLSPSVARGRLKGGSDVRGTPPSPDSTKNFATHLLPRSHLTQAGAPLLGVAAVAAWLHVSTATIYRLCSEGKLDHCRVSNAIRIAPSAVAAYIESAGGR